MHVPKTLTMQKLKFPIINLGFLSFLIITLSALSFSPVWYSDYKPIIMDRTELENAVKLKEPRPIEKAGKIYLKDNYIFISESMKGIHVIDNTDPTMPENIGFIHIDGCIDMAMKGDILFADNAVDLIAIRLNSTITDIEITSRVRNVFPEFHTPDGLPMAGEIYRNLGENMVIVGWELISN